MGRTRRQVPPVVTMVNASQQTSAEVTTGTNQQPSNHNGNPNSAHKNDIEVVSSDSDEKPTPSSISKPKIQIYKGHNDKVSIENWTKRYDMLSNYYKWSDKTKIVMLGNYLEDDALNWYIENCNDSDNYVSLISKLITRFGLETVEPIVDFVNHRYDLKNGIKAYFETKRRYGIAAKLTEEQMIPLMIINLHPKMIENFTAVKPRTFVEFYTIAQKAESNLKRQFNRNNDQNSSKPKSKSENTDKGKRKPPNPCRICENMGFKNRYHWGNECRNRGKTNPQNQTNGKTINTISSTDDPMSENDITKIDLN